MIEQFMGIMVISWDFTIYYGYDGNLELHQQYVVYIYILWRNSHDVSLGLEQQREDNGQGMEEAPGEECCDEKLHSNTKKHCMFVKIPDLWNEKYLENYFFFPLNVLYYV